MTVFGDILTDDAIAEVVLEHLRKWTPTYLREIERQRGLASPYWELPAASSFTLRSDFAKWGEDMLPAIAVVYAGTDDDPVKSGDRTYEATYPLAIVAIASNNDALQTRKQSAHLATAALLAILQKPSMDGSLDVQAVTWGGQRSEDLSPEDERTIWGTRHLVAVTIRGVIRSSGGPLVPSESALPAVPIVPDFDHVVTDPDSTVYPGVIDVPSTTP